MPQRNPEEIWEKLAKSVPKTNAEWEDARSRHGFDSAERIPGTIARLLNGPEENHDLCTVVFLARCKVVSHGAGKKVPYDDAKQFFGKDNSEATIVAYINAVVKLVKLLDELYLCGLRHRAFELLLYVPKKLAYLRQYTNSPSKFKSYFAAATTSPPEIQGSAVPCIQFLVGWKYTDLKYDSICEALGTRLFDQQEFDKFISAVKTGKLDSRLPPLPSTTPPLRIVQHFAIFSLSERLKKQARDSAGQLRGWNLMPPGTPVAAELHSYWWSSAHQAVVDETISCLLSLKFLVRGEYWHYSSRAIHHETGSLPTPDGKFQVIVPIIQNEKEHCEVLLETNGHRNRATWSSKSGFLLNQTTSLLTQDPIDYILIRL
ncbi:hypothetical protein FALBO_1375 [Fusarium albosuccineum]|uniref:Uncharacterized protein n=1 Tax=Fusarium albosuccineum TaxID=1237068 RepID=A0A8H4LQ10_9HYPO|nr:hypothetical protein FALBO_1375 [Fusarium albosuccineum]